MILYWIFIEYNSIVYKLLQLNLPLLWNKKPYHVFVYQNFEYNTSGTFICFSWYPKQSIVINASYIVQQQKSIAKVNTEWSKSLFSFCFKSETPLKHWRDIYVKNIGRTEIVLYNQQALSMHVSYVLIYIMLGV